MNEIKVNLENLSEDERELLMSLIEKANNSKSKVWKPVNDETYYYIDEVGIGETKWSDSFYQDTFLYEIGNLFRTEDEAEEEIQRRKICKQWENLSIESGEADNPWNGENQHWVCYYSSYYDKVKTDCITSAKEANIYFTTHESLLNAIEAIGEENVRKYILRVD